MIQLQLGAGVAFFLALLRGTAFLYFCPPFSNNMIPFLGKTGIAAGLAVAAVPTVSHDALPTSVPALVGALVVQIAVGALIGFVVQLFVGAVQGAGSIIDQFS